MLSPDDPLPLGGRVSHVSWPGVFTGLVLLALFGGLGVVQLRDEYALRQPPAELTVEQALDRSHAGPVQHVRLTDLSLDCSTVTPSRSSVHVHVRGRDGDLLVELRDTPCIDGPTTLVGDLEPVPEDMRRTGVRTNLAVLRPRTSHPEHLLFALVMVALAVFALVQSTRDGKDAFDRVRRRLAARDQPVTTVPFSDRWLLPFVLEPDEPRIRRDARRSALATTFAALLLAPAVYHTASTIHAAAQTAEIWNHGVTATAVEARVTDETYKLVIHVSRIAVVYTDAAGLRRHGVVARTGLGELAPRGLPVVRHAPDDPARFALSWQLDARPGELALHLLTALLFGTLSLLLLRHQRRHAAHTRVRAVLRTSPEEVALDVLSATPFEHKGQRLGTRYTLKIPGGSQLDHETTADDPPLFLDLDSTKILGLCRPGDRSFAVVIHEDMAPLRAPADEAERVRDRWRARMNPALTAALATEPGTPPRRTRPRPPRTPRAPRGPAGTAP